MRKARWDVRQDVKGAPLGRVNERLAGGQPGTLTAWLKHRQRQMLQRYCVQKMTRVRLLITGVERSVTIFPSPPYGLAVYCRNTSERRPTGC
jgi:hypothetical protein